MKAIEQHHYILSIPRNLSLIEFAGRTCYKSESKTSESEFIKKLIKMGHYSVLEHLSVTVKLITDRGVSHELVRHRLASYSQESTRYCNYSHEKFGNEITFIEPVYWSRNSVEYAVWHSAMHFAENRYMYLLNSGAKPEEARAILPNSLKTEVVMTANIREWLHIFHLRTSTKAHPQMRSLMLDVLKSFQIHLPTVFEGAEL